MLLFSTPRFPNCIKPTISLAAGAVLAAAAAGCQTPTPDHSGSRADYERSAGLEALYEGAVPHYYHRAPGERDPHLEVEPHWLAGGEQFWYADYLPGGRVQYVLIDAAQAERRPAFDHAALAEALTRETEKEYAPDELWLDGLIFAQNGKFVLLNIEGQNWKWDLEEAKLEKGSGGKSREKNEDGPRRPNFGPPWTHEFPSSPVSPDGRWTVELRDNNLHLRDNQTQSVEPLTTDGTDGKNYDITEIYWSPDSAKIVAMDYMAAPKHKVYMVESSPDGQVQPNLQSIDYYKPGDRIPVQKPCLFDAATRERIPVDDALLPNPWPFEGVQLHWDADSSRFLYYYNQRGHQVLRVIAIDAQSGEATPIVDEQSKTFIDYRGKTFLKFLDETSELIWMSERSGWNHLYLYDAKTGAVKNAITSGEWVVRSVEKVDAEKRRVWFWAGGIDPAQDPYYLHLCRVNFDGSGLIDLTPGDGTHSVKFSPGGRWIVDKYSRVDMAPVNELRSAKDGRLVLELERAPLDALIKTGWIAPEPFEAPGRDGKTPIYGVIWRPMHFDPDRKYPVIEYIYAGPHDSFVPKDFHMNYPQIQALAELGFIVVQIDAMGTNNRSKAFHDVCWKNLRDSGFPDRIAWIRAAAETHPCMDLDRIGIYGGSAGGQSALAAMLQHGDFYKAAMADSGCHDNRMDKIWWNEQWMGWPVGPEYAENSNVTMAGNLTGKLLLIVGELDSNVDPASTMQVVNALIEADRDFELLVMPGENHGCGTATSYGWRRTRDFFVRSLIGTEPRHE